MRCCCVCVCGGVLPGAHGLTRPRRESGLRKGWTRGQPPEEQDLQRVLGGLFGKRGYSPRLGGLGLALAMPTARAGARGARPLILAMVTPPALGVLSVCLGCTPGASASDPGDRRPRLALGGFRDTRRPRNNSYTIRSEVRPGRGRH